MPLDFPASPTNGQIYDRYVYSSTTGTWNISPLSTLTLSGSTLNINGATPTIASTNASAASIFPLNVTGITIGSSTIRTTEFPADGTTSTATVAAGYMGMPQRLDPQTANAYTLIAGDAGKHLYFTTGTNTLTIPANGTTAFPIGTTISIINGSSAGNLTIQITTDTLRLAGSTFTGTRTLAANGMATLIKVASALWYINGSGLT